MQITLLCTYLEHEGEGWRAFRLHFQRSRKKLRRELASYFEIASSPPSSSSTSSSGKLIKLRLHQYFNNGLECAIHKFTSVSADDSSHPPFPFPLSFSLPFFISNHFFFIFSSFSIFSFFLFFVSFLCGSFISSFCLFSDSSYFSSLFISLFLTLFFYLSSFSIFFLFILSFIFFTLPLSFF